MAKKKHLPTLNKKTLRLFLRLFRPNDITPEYIQALNNQQIIGLTESRYRSWNFEEVKDYVKQKGDTPDSMLIGIFIKDSKRHIGNIRLHSFSHYNKRVEVGIMIWDKKEWGKDYGTEAMTALVDYVFKELKMHKVCAEYYSINKGSEKMFKKLSFSIEGVFKDHFFVNGQYIDAVRVAKFNPNNYV